MKFTDGNWLIREGYEIHYPHMVFDMDVTDESLTLYTPCRDIVHRGMTLNCPQLTIKLTVPKENVIRLQTWHHTGGVKRTPAFDVADEKLTSTYVSEENELIFGNGDVKVKIQKRPFHMTFYYKNDMMTEMDAKSFAWIEGPENTNYMRGQHRLSVGEYLYGLGERFTTYVKNGQSVDIWNKDGGTSSEQAYKNIPFYLSNRGYGIFVNHPEEVNYELGSEYTSKSQFSIKGEYLDYYVIIGPEPKGVVSRYTELTGKPALPPAWSFGLWLSTSFTTDYNEETVNRFVDGMIERDIPLSVFHFDCFWMKGFEWSNFIWDQYNFPDPEGMLRRLKEKGLKICVWINPYIAQQSPLFEEGAKNGYLLKKEDGSIWQWDLWQAGMGIVDFTNPKACEWYTSKLKILMDMGVDSFKTDFGERIPTDVVYFDGSDPVKMHNYYSYIYNKVVFDLLEKERGKNEAVLFARSATTGGQKFPVHWGGDCDSTYEAMAESLRGGLSLTTSGFGYWSHDIGGFENTATPDVFKRWTAFGLLSSHSRLHGSSSYRVPWNFDEVAVDVTRQFAKLKNRLMPYLFGAAVENHHTGVPVMRSMLLEFPDDPICEPLDRQYMLGDALLVAPIFNEEGIGSFYLPKGRWTCLLTGEVVEGGTWVKEKFDYLNLPLYIRPNTILPIGLTDNTPVYDYTENLTIKLVEIEDGANIDRMLVNADGEEIGHIHVTRTGNEISITTSGLEKPYTIEVSGKQKLEVEAGKQEMKILI